MTEMVDVALAEFEALRGELLQLHQGQVAMFTAAFTVTAAIGGFALSRTSGHVELLLVLPVVLCGLGLIQAQYSRQSHQIGDYIRECLWLRLPTHPGDAVPSWEHYISNSRRRFHGIVARLLIFAVPSIACIVITYRQWNTGLAPLWWSDIIILGTTGLLGLAVIYETRPSLAKHSH
jgi:hypothetical protein